MVLSVNTATNRLFSGQRRFSFSQSVHILFKTPVAALRLGLLPLNGTRREQQALNTKLQQSDSFCPLTGGTVGVSRSWKLEAA